MQIAPWVFPLTKETASVPRMCGEKIRAVSATTASVGSPPRVRGKVSPVRISHRHNRITPACAGKRTWPSPAAQPLWDHPRVCGEKPVSVPPMYQLPGSPCGEKGRPTAASACPSGITPACAGKRQVVHDELPWLEDHPRVCGEKGNTGWTTECGMGSPPRVRGKDDRSEEQKQFRGITPACAGKSV